MGLLSFLGLESKSAKITEFISKGAVIIDVRTVVEYKEGHIKDSKNIPLNTIYSKIEDIKKLNKPVIACCASGMRSAQATSILKSNGIDCINGGGWYGLNSKI